MATQHQAAQRCSAFVEGRQLTVANVGDSVAVLVRGGKAAAIEQQPHCRQG